MLLFRWYQCNRQLTEHDVGMLVWVYFFSYLHRGACTELYRFNQLKSLALASSRDFGKKHMILELFIDVPGCKKFHINEISNIKRRLVCHLAEWEE